LNGYLYKRGKRNNIREKSGKNNKGNEAENYGEGRKTSSRQLKLIYLLDGKRYIICIKKNTTSK